MKKINKENIAEYIICLGITILFFGIFIKFDFATDTYAIIENPYSENLQNFLKSRKNNYCYF